MDGVPEDFDKQVGYYILAENDAPSCKCTR